MTMPMNQPNRTLDRVLRIAAWGGAAALWLLPLVAMQFTNEVAWSPFDFALWAVMLIAGAGVFELSLRAPGGWAYRLASIIALGVAFVLVWGNLAVGLVGSEDNAVNLLFLGVLAIGGVGAFMVRLRAGGMAVVLLIMAVLQIAATAAGVMLAGGDLPMDSLRPTWTLSAVFALAWLFAAALFRSADARG